MSTPTPRTDECLNGREHGNAIEFLARDLERELSATEVCAGNAQIAEYVKSLEGRVSDLEGRVSDLEGRVSDLEDTVANYQDR